MLPTMATETQQRVQKIIAALKKTHPDAKLALHFSTPLDLLIALILAAQARDDLVNTVTAEVFPKYRTAADWMNVAEEEFKRINFYRNKTKAIRAACRQLVENHAGKVPDNLDALLELTGVGRKTANILLGNAFGQPAIGVDTHVMRLSQRLGLTGQKNPDKIEAELTPLVPAKDAVKFCHLLAFHGRRVCNAKKPDCQNCSINKLCPKIGI
jgi:endonuclease-3